MSRYRPSLVVSVTAKTVRRILCYTHQPDRASHRRTGAETVSVDERCPSEHGGRSVSSARFSGTSENTRQTDEVSDSLLEFIGYVPAAVGYVVGEVIVKDQ